MLPFPPSTHLAGGGSPSLAPAGVPRVLTVRPHEVDVDDVLVGHPRRRVAKLLQHDGWTWHFYDYDGISIATAQPGARVQVIRGALGNDECPPYGLERPARHLEVVR